MRRAEPMATTQTASESRSWWISRRRTCFAAAPLVNQPFTALDSNPETTRKTTTTARLALITIASKATRVAFHWRP